MVISRDVLSMLAVSSRLVLLMSLNSAHLADAITCDSLLVLSPVFILKLVTHLLLTTSKEL